jgi:hypothetical protein
MRRTRLVGVALATLVLLLAVSSLASAGEPGGDVLAVEAPAEGEPLPGPEPRLDGHEFGPRDYDVPWTYGMGVALAGVALLAVLGTAAGYWLLVARPQRESQES